MCSKTMRDSVLELAGDRAVIRASDLRALRLSESYLRYLASRGDLQRVARGLYAPIQQSLTENHRLAEVAVAAPRAVICLLSALRFHGIGTQMPDVTWIALPTSYHVPRSLEGTVHAVSTGPAGYALGVEEHQVEGIKVPIYSVAKTITDCFKFRSAVGPDVAVEALRDALGKRLVKPVTLYPLARANRVVRLMEPYLEALQ